MSLSWGNQIISYLPELTLSAFILIVSLLYKTFNRESFLRDGHLESLKKQFTKYGEIFSNLFRNNTDTLPGPSRFSIWPMLLYLKSKYPFEVMMQLSRTYGNIFSVYLGTRHVVVLTDVRSIKEAFLKDEFMSSPTNSHFSIFKHAGIMNLSGNTYKEQRRCFQHALRNIGFKFNQIESLLKNEIAQTIDALENLNGKATCIDQLLLSSALNNIWLLIFSHCFKYEDEVMHTLLETHHTTINAISPPCLHLFVPFLKPLLMGLALGKYAHVAQRVKDLEVFVRKEIKEHKETMDPNNPRDYIDVYISEMDKRKPNSGSFNEDTLVGNIFVFALGGTDTTAASVGWFLLTMAGFPHVQQRIQSEIDDVIGKERSPAFEDKKMLPYTQAVLMEISRWKTVIPITPFHGTAQTTTVGGYRIPKGSLTTANIWAVHHDPTYWKNPDQFVPDRFLDKDGKTITKSEMFIPFSLGKRSCPGEKMADISLFLYATSILQRYDVSLEDGAVADFKGLYNVVYYPKPQKLRFILRN